MASSISSTSAVSQDQFLTLLVAQLQNQDPLNPVSDTEFVSQLAQFSTLQSIQTLGSNFSQMLKLQQISQGTDLIGKTVEFTQNGSSTVETGTVDRLVVNSGNIFLQIGSAQVSLDNLRGVLP